MKQSYSHTKMKMVIGMIIAGVVCSVPLSGADATTTAPLKESLAEIHTAGTVTCVRASNPTMVQAVNVMDHNMDPVLDVKKCEMHGQKSFETIKKNREK